MNYLLIRCRNGGICSVVDGDLLPYTQYNYSIMASNSVGSVTSGWTTATTREAEPSQLAAPICQTNNNRLDTIQLFWTSPAIPNGLSMSDLIAYIEIYLYLVSLLQNMQLNI